MGERYVRRRMRELGIPETENGQPDYGGDGRWRAFDPRGDTGGANTTGVTVDSGVLNPDLLKGKKGGRIWPKMRLKDRIDAIIAHEYEELRDGGVARRRPEGRGRGRNCRSATRRGGCAGRWRGKTDCITSGRCLCSDTFHQFKPPVPAPIGPAIGRFGTAGKGTPQQDDPGRRQLAERGPIIGHDLDAAEGQSPQQLPGGSRQVTCIGVLIGSRSIRSRPDRTITAVVWDVAGSRISLLPRSPN